MGYLVRLYIKKNNKKFDLPIRKARINKTASVICLGKCLEHSRCSNDTEKQWYEKTGGSVEQVIFNPHLEE